VEEAGSVARVPADGSTAVQAGDAHPPVLGPSSRLSEVLAEYLKQARTKDGDGGAEDDVGLIVRFVIDLIGDLAMDDLTPSHFLTIENALPDIPHPHGVPALHRTSLHARYLYAKDEGWDSLRRLSKARIIQTYHRCLHAFFQWAADHHAYNGRLFRFRLVGKSNRGDKKRDSWHDDEIVKLFSLPLFTGSHSRARHWQAGDRLIQNEIYWAFLMIFFMGVRPSEIGRTRADDVRFINGRWYLDYRDKSPDSEAEGQVKAEASARLVPIHPLLIDLGLLDRHADLIKAGEKMLFPEWKLYTRPRTGERMWGHSFSKAWQYVRRTFEFERQDLTLYGGRHTRASWYDEAKLPNRVRLRVLGHKPTDVADMYGAKYLTPAETDLVLSVSNSVEEEVAGILLTAKLRAMEGELQTIRTW
jgi:integrase